MLVGASAEERVWKFMDQRDEFKLFIHNKKKAVGNPGEGPGGLLPICGANWGPKGRKRINLRPGPPYLRVWMTAVTFTLYTLSFL